MNAILHLLKLVGGAGEQQQVFADKKDFTVTVTPEMLEKAVDDYIVQWPLQLAAGDYTAVITIENAVDSRRSSKKINFTI